MIWVALAWAIAPADLAPGAPELQAAERRLRSLLDASLSTGAATARLQVQWTRGVTTGDPCADFDRLDLGWRIERFGAAWREATQAAIAQSERTRKYRNAPTVAPLVDARWAAALDAMFAEAAAQAGAMLEASAWQATWVRPTLGACPIEPAHLSEGVREEPLAAAQERELPTAVLALGDGWVCPAAVRADDAIVLVTGGKACFSPDHACSCEPAPVWPGAVLGAAVAGGERGVEEAGL